jgi:phosphatidylserine decarboxylase
MLNKSFTVVLQYLLPQHALSRLAGWLATRRWLWLKNWEIHYFINRYNVDLAAALSDNIADYPDFNSFFTRKLKANQRPIAKETNALVCPADGCISQIGLIQENLLFQAKGFHFRLQDLLGGNATLADEFYNGSFATIYLAPKDYHRVHMPLAGTLRKTSYIPGKLFSVNQKTVTGVPNLFAHNERLVCIFDTEIGPMAVVLVGAMLVGNIKTVWDTKASSPGKICHKSYPVSGTDSVSLERGAELGYFQMGSTVIILLPRAKTRWNASLQKNTPTLMGESFGEILPS